MITLFPIAYWKTNTGTSNGRNFPFVCWANKDHPWAAAIMAQEIYESRFTTVRLLAVTAVLVGAAAFAAYGTGRSPTYMDMAATVAICAAIAALFTGLFPPWQREAELRGQAVECEVRHDYYGSLIRPAITDAANQLMGYKQFKGMTFEELYEEIRKRRKWGVGDWVKKNQKMIERAFGGPKPPHDH